MDIEFCIGFRSSILINKLNVRLTNVGLTHFVERFRGQPVDLACSRLVNFLLFMDISMVICRFDFMNDEQSSVLHKIYFESYTWNLTTRKWFDEI